MIDNICKFLAESFSADFASWILGESIILRLLRSEIMKESVIYQDILLEGMAEGMAEGIAKGIAIGLTH